jgi:hypothetical protein
MSLMFQTSPYTTNTTQTSMPPAGFEPTIPARERLQNQALDRAVSGIGTFEPTIPVSERPQIYALDSAATGIGGNNIA